MRTQNSAEECEDSSCLSSSQTNKTTEEKLRQVNYEHRQNRISDVCNILGLASVV